MAIDDLQGLMEQLPEVFDVRTPPPAWGSDWIIVAINDPESPTAAIIEADKLNEPDQRADDAALGQWPSPDYS
jgi:hypothetical protein